MLAGPAWSPLAEAEPPEDQVVSTSESEGEAQSPQPGPIEFLIGLARQQLAVAGFERREEEIHGRRQVWWEKGEGPVLVLVHGVNDQAGGWMQVAPQLAASHRVLIPDLPGHGESAPAEGPLSMATVVEGFEHWLASRASAEEPTILVGNSMGAWLGALAARRHPDRVVRVILVNGGPLRAESGELDLMPADVEEARRLMASIRDAKSAPIPEPVLADLVRRAPHSAVARMAAAGEDFDAHLLSAEHLGELSVPIDIVWGESDRLLGDGYLEQLREALPRARVEKLPECGHIPQVECSPRLLDALEALLPAQASEEPAR